MAEAKAPQKRLRKPQPAPAPPSGPGDPFGEAFMADFLVVWREHGPAAMKTVAAERPQDLVRAALAILPREAGAKASEFDDLDDEQLAARVRKLQRALADAGLSGGWAGEPDASPAQPAEPL